MNKKDIESAVKTLVRKNRLPAGLLVFVHRDGHSPDGRLGMVGYSQDPRAEAALRPLAEAFAKTLGAPGLDEESDEDRKRAAAEKQVAEFKDEIRAVPGGSAVALEKATTAAKVAAAFRKATRSNPELAKARSNGKLPKLHEFMLSQGGITMKTRKETQVVSRGEEERDGP